MSHPNPAAPECPADQPDDLARWAGLVLDSMRDPVLCVDTRNRVVAANNAARDAFHRLTPGIDLGETFVDDGGLGAILTRTRDEQRSGRLSDVTLIDRSGEARLFALETVWLDDSHGIVAVILRDRERDRQVTAHQIRAEAGRASARLTGEFRAELAPLLVGALGSLHLLANRVSEDEQAILRVAVAEIDHIRGVLDRLPGMPVAATDDVSPTNCHRCIETGLDVLADRPTLLAGIQRQFDPTLPDADVSGERLVRALELVFEAAAASLTSRAGGLQLTTRFAQPWHQAGRGLPSVSHPVGLSVAWRGEALSVLARVRLDIAASLIDEALGLFALSEDAGRYEVAIALRRARP